MNPESGATPGASRLLYPHLPDLPTTAELHRLFIPSYDERAWASTVARTPISQVALLVHLKIFQSVGRFLRVKNIPSFVIEHVAHRLGVDCKPLLVYTESTLYRHHVAVLGRLGVTSWGPAARQVARRTMTTIAEARTDPAELINAAIDALVRGRFELPTLDALRRLAATVHSKTNTAQMAPDKYSGQRASPLGA
jgi:hypothetical protein